MTIETTPVVTTTPTLPTPPVVAPVLPEGTPPVIAPIKEPIDITKLDPEIQKVIDQERLRASQTAAKNAKEKLLADPTFLKSIQDEALRQASLTAEQKLTEEQGKLNKTMESLNLKENKLKATQLLMATNMSYEQAQKAIEFVATSDWETTQSRVNEFLSMFSQTVNSTVSEQLKTKLGSTPPPITGGSGVVTKETLLAEFKTASQNGDNLAMARITRQLSELK